MREGGGGLRWQDGGKFKQKHHPEIEKNEGESVLVACSFFGNNSLFHSVAKRYAGVLGHHFTMKF